MVILALWPRQQLHSTAPAGHPQAGAALLLTALPAPKKRQAHPEQSPEKRKQQQPEEGLDALNLRGSQEAAI